VALLSTNKIRRIDAAGRRILERTGIRILDKKVLETLQSSGADIDLTNQRARFPLQWLDEILTNTPSQCILYSRDGKNDLVLGTDQVYFGNGGRVFRVLDMATQGYRPTQLRDVADTAGLVDLLDHLSFYIIACQAHDVDFSSYHLNDFFQAFSNTTKHVMGGCDTLEGVKQTWELASFIADGTDKLRARPFVSVITNPISPLTLDATTLHIIEFCGRHGIPLTCAPAPIAGATGPTTLAGTLAQMHAEALAGVAIAQVFSPGSSVMYGAVPASMDLRTMDLAMGSVETSMMSTCAVDLAKIYDLPIYASAGVTDAKVPDIQSGFEKGVSCLLVAMAGGDYIHLAAGMLDSGNSISYEQFVIDNEILGMVYRILDGIDVDADNLAVDLIEKVGPGGNYIMEEHTIENMYKQFFYPTLAVRKNFDLWENEARPTPLTRAHALVQEWRQGHQTVLDPELVRDTKKKFVGIVNP
jgi:trimethylamine--corrinoid protein Co-methyltransferase